jgi:hypothetical protein
VLKQLTFQIWEALGWSLCELAFKTDCRGPFALAYRAGCWCYGKAEDFRYKDGLPGQARR